MNKYEKAQVEAIEAWKLTEPSVVHRAFEQVTAPFTWAATKVIPAKLVQTAIEGANSAAQGLVDADALLPTARSIRSRSCAPRACRWPTNWRVRRIAGRSPSVAPAARRLAPPALAASRSMSAHC